MNYIEMITALTSDYLNVYYIEPEKDQGTIVKLNGYVIEGILNTPENFCYSQMLRKYAMNRVWKEDQENFLDEVLPESLISLFSGDREKIEFNYRVLVDNKLQHYSGLYMRISNQEEPLALVAGFRNTEDIISIQKKNRTEGLLSAYHAISDVYLSMHRINLKDNTYTTIKTTDAILKYTLKNSNQFDENINSIIQNLAKDERYDSALEFVDIQTLEKRLEGKKHISIPFEGKIAGSCKLHFIKEDVDEDGKLWHVIFAVEVLDENEYQSVFDVLSRNFKNVYLVDLKHGYAKVLKQENNRIQQVANQPIVYEPLLNQWIEKVIHPDDQQMLKNALSVQHLRDIFSKQDEYTGNYRAIVNGQIVNYQFFLSKLNKKDHIIAAFQNIEDMIQEHIRLEQEEREKERKYQKELESQLAIVNILSKNFRNVFMANLNDCTAKILKIADDYELNDLRNYQQKIFSFDSIVEYWISQRIHPDDQDRIRQALDVTNLKNVFKQKDEYTGTYRSFDQGKYCNYQFTIKKLDEEGNVIIGFQIIDAIIEEHLIQEKKEREKEEAYQRELRKHAEVISSLSTIYSTIFRAELDTHTYEVLNSVELMGELAGTKGNFDDVKESILQSFMSKDMQEQMRDFLDFNTLAERLKDINTIVTEYKNPNGRWFQARFIVKRRDEKGIVKEVLYVARDFTEEKEKELQQQEQLSLALASARQANRAKTTFLNSMSHDIRTPMNAIIGFTALAQTHLDDQKQVQDYLGKISTSSTHLLSLINDILDMSRIESGVVKLDEKPVHIPDVIHDLRTMIQGLVNAKNQNLFIDTQDLKHEDVITDKLRLNQVLINIVGNAIKFTQVGGDIMIRLVEKPCAIKNYTTYEFTVKDNGIGMSEKFVEHIFDTFTREYSTTVSGIQGSGLGMAITKNIVVDMMGGNIDVQSEEGKGSTFTVTLNLKLTESSVKNEPIQELLGARVLIVDDDINTCRSVSKMLHDIQMRPDWTTSGKEAIIRAQDASEMKDEYKVYIIDYLMPDMNGIETIRRIRKVISEEVPIIVLTAYDWDDFEAEAREAGVTAFVSKPIFMSELRSVLTNPKQTESKKIINEKKHYDYHGKRALLAEDNELNREIAIAILSETGMVVDSVADGDLAVATINESPCDKYDVIFMDIQMPRMDGYTATREIRTLPDNHKANIPIIAMTANAFEEDKKKTFETGMNGHIVKPINIDDIACVLDKVFIKK